MTGLTLKTRIRDAELSVRTANGLCSMYGEDVKFEHFVDPGPDELEMFRVIGRKGLKELKEVLGYAITGSFLAKPPVGGSSIVAPSETKTLRDEFAMAALTGIIAGLGQFSDFAHTAEAAYKMADAMMEARDK